MKILKPTEGRASGMKPFTRTQLVFLILFFVSPVFLFECSSIRPRKIKEGCPIEPKTGGRYYIISLGGDSTNLFTPEEVRRLNDAVKKKQRRDSFMALLLEKIPDTSELYQDFDSVFGLIEKDRLIRTCGCDQSLVLMKSRINLEDRTAETSEQAEEEWGIRKNYRLRIIDPIWNIRKWKFGKPGYRKPPVRNADTNRVVVALIDSGIDIWNHDSLNDVIWDPREAARWTDGPVDDSCFVNDNFGYDFYNEGKKIPIDYSGHGTHLAGIIALGEKTPPGLRLMNLKVTKNRSSKVDLFSAACAFSYALNNGAKIINLSWGYYHKYDTTRRKKPRKEKVADKASMKDSIRARSILYPLFKKASKKGVLVITSAGNDSLDTDTCCHWPSGSGGLDTLDNVIAVTALGKNKDDIAWFSNYGRNTVHYAVPGTDILSTYPDSTNRRKRFDGTSQAAAYITRLAAQYYANHLYCDYSDFIKYLDSIGEPLISEKPTIKELKIRQ